jgi:hypothetical protein
MKARPFSQGTDSKLADCPTRGWEAVLPNPKLKLLDQVREVMSLKHYSILTERSYCDWIRRYVRFHHMLARQELLPALARVEVFLSDLTPWETPFHNQDIQNILAVAVQSSAEISVRLAFKWLCCSS